MSYCKYYQAKVKREKCSFFVAILRSFEHLCFDRTLDKKESLFEFFVPENNQDYFLEIINCFIDLNIVTEFKELENRLINLDHI